MTVSSVLIDLDGTLADSIGVMKTAYYRFLEKRGRSGSAEEFDSLNGPPLAEIITILKQRHNLSDSHETLLRDYRDQISEVYRDVSPMDGAVPLLEWCRANRIRVAVVTSNSRILAQSWLDRSGLAKFIDSVIGSEDVSKGKPDPEPYDKAIDSLGAAPASSCAIEDSRMGALSATGAGVHTFLLDACGEPAPAGSSKVAGSLVEVLSHLKKRHIQSD